MSSRPISALCRAALAIAVALLATAPAAADALRWSHLETASNGEPASGPPSWAADSNVKRTSNLAPETWWDNDSSWNRYSYALNNPVRYVDPEGRVVVVDDLAAAAGLFFATGAVITWWNSPAPANPRITNGQLVANDVIGVANRVGQSLRKISSPDRYKSKDKAGRDRDRQKQDRWEKKEPKPEPASDNDPPSPDDLVSPGPLRIPPGAGTIIKFARTAGDLPGGTNGPTMGAASAVLLAMSAHETVGRGNGDGGRDVGPGAQTSADRNGWNLVPSH